MHFWRLVNKIQTNVMCIVVSQVKLQPKRIKSALAVCKFLPDGVKQGNKTCLDSIGIHA